MNCFGINHIIPEKNALASHGLSKLDWLYIALAVMGAVGLGVAATGAIGFCARHHLFSAGLFNHLDYSGSISLMLTGVLLTIAGMRGTYGLCHKRKAQLIDEHPSPIKSIEQISQVTIKECSGLYLSNNNDHHVVIITLNDGKVINTFFTCIKAAVLACALPNITTNEDPAHFEKYRNDPSLPPIESVLSYKSLKCLDWQPSLEKSNNEANAIQIPASLKLASEQRFEDIFIRSHPFCGYKE